MTSSRLPLARVAIRLLAASIGAGLGRLRRRLPGPGRRLRHAGHGRVLLPAAVRHGRRSAAPTSASRPHQARRRAARPRADPAGRRRREQGAPWSSTRRASSRPSTRRSTRRRRTVPWTSPPPRPRPDLHPDRVRASSTPTRPAAPTRTSGSTRVRYAAVAQAIADRLTRLDPAHRGRLRRPTPRPSGRSSRRSTRELRSGPRPLHQHRRSSPATPPSATSPSATG